jgi:hypothetical protein
MLPVDVPVFLNHSLVTMLMEKSVSTGAACNALYVTTIYTDGSTTKRTKRMAAYFGGKSPFLD